MNTNKLVLGTANFAEVYDGTQVTDIDKIFAYCREVGIEYVDTAVAYGSEYLIPPDFKAITKFPAIQQPTIRKIDRIFNHSLERLKQKKLYGYLLHRASDYNGLVWKCLQQYKYRGLVEKIGISIYEPQEIQNVDIIQCPYKKFKSYFPMLKEIGVEIHARKVFADNCFLEAIADENVDYVVIGIDNLEQLKQNAELVEKETK